MAEPPSPVTGSERPAIDADLLDIVRQARFGYPIESKEQFVRQLEGVGDEVLFRGSSYETSTVAALIPEFFFPVLSEADLLEKGHELLVARGLAPASAQPLEAG